MAPYPGRCRSRVTPTAPKTCPKALVCHKIYALRSTSIGTLRHVPYSRSRLRWCCRLLARQSRKLTLRLHNSCCVDSAMHMSPSQVPKSDARRHMYMKVRFDLPCVILGIAFALRACQRTIRLVEGHSALPRDKWIAFRTSLGRHDSSRTWWLEHRLRRTCREAFRTLVNIARVASASSRSIDRE